MTVTEDASFAAKNTDNWLWVTFTRSDPARDIYGANSHFENKHWTCQAPLCIDARMKPQMQAVVEEDPQIEALARDILHRAQKQQFRQ